MIKNKSETESKILNCAYKVFVLYGYHATSLQQIANEAQLNQAMIHYYFRSKERLYGLVLKHLINFVISNDVETIKNIGTEKIAWFLNTEQYNNKILFEKNLERLYPDDYEEIRESIQNFIYSKVRIGIAQNNA